MDIDLRPVRGSPSAEFSRKGGTPPESVHSYVVKGVWGRDRKGMNGKKRRTRKTFSSLKVQRLMRPSSRVTRLAVIAHAKRLASGEPGAWVGEWASGLVG